MRNVAPFLLRPLGRPLSLDEFADDVRSGLCRNGQKQIQSKYLYDALGSALFEAITLLPEYGLTRADERLLQTHAPDLVKRAGTVSVVAELGSGSGLKTRHVLDALDSSDLVTYCPIDISPSALNRCERELRRNGLNIVPIEESYIAGLRLAATLRRKHTSMLVLFLGSTLGNLEPNAAVNLCSEVRNTLQPGDIFYLSTDLQKFIDQMIAVYDDALGVTVAFNLNLLVRINRELKGAFDLTRFAHHATYDVHEGRIEMHLRSLVDQTVVAGRDLTAGFRKNETIWTESSYKFRSEDLIALAGRTRFHCEAQWIDEDWPFAQSLFRAV